VKSEDDKEFQVNRDFIYIIILVNVGRYALHHNSCDNYYILTRTVSPFLSVCLCDQLQLCPSSAALTLLVG